MDHKSTRFEPALEREYRQYYLSADVNQLVLGVILWVVPALGFAYGDFLLFGISTPFWRLFFARLGYAGLSIFIIVILLRRISTPLAFDRVTLAWGLLTVLLKLVVNFLRPRTDLSVFMNDLVGVIGFYIFIANRTLLRAIPAVLIMILDLSLAAFYKVGMVGLMMTSLAFSFTLSNLVGIVFSRHYLAGRRLAFLARKKEVRIQAELQRLASTDPLTGVFNRRKLLELAEEAFYRHRRYRRPFSIMLIDLDGFKKVNDTFGHQQGDAVLIQFAKTVMEEKRVADALGRIGGDEFCLVLPETLPEDAAVLAGRILERCDELGPDTGPECGLPQASVTSSIGMSEVRPDDGILDTLFARADAALYQAKNSGRNRWIIV